MVFGAWWCHSSPLTYLSHLMSHIISQILTAASTHSPQLTPVTTQHLIKQCPTAARSGKGKNNTLTSQSFLGGVKSSTNTKAKEGYCCKSNSQYATSRFHKMNIKDIHASDHHFNVYQLDNLRTNFCNLKSKIGATNERVEFDNRAVSAHKINYPRPTTTHGGYPHWNGHPAKKHLEDDVCDGTADKMLPQALRDTRQSYKEFPVTVFCQRVHSEKEKQRGAAFWVEKRNRKGMKQRLEEVAETRMK